MPAALIPSPSRGLWHIGPVPLRGYALCVLLGIAVCLWVTDRRYRRMGGHPGQVLDMATVAVPFGLVGARAYGVLTNYHLYFGHHRDWVNILRIWDGWFGMPGGVAAAALGAWIACRRQGVRLSPVAGAAAPGLAFAAAIASWGNWFSQQVYGRPATVPWALEIAPVHRVPGYENFATFQPVFLYASIWDVLTGVLVILLARRFRLTGDRTFACYAALQAAGSVSTGLLRIGYGDLLDGIAVNQILLTAVLAAAAGYLYLTRGRTGPDVVGQATGTAPGSAAGVAPGRAGVGGGGPGGTASPSFH
jgi:prolipoprotein diacylglyceryltransferase